jgi:endonuclease/exonuclease/phosphatase family metal-dependent hydrolase
MGTPLRVTLVFVVGCVPAPARDWPEELAWPSELGRGDVVLPVAVVPVEVRVRLATFNASMFRAKSGQLRAELAAGDPQAHLVAETLQRIAPDIVLLSEIDQDPEAVAIFRDRYLASPHGDAPALALPYAIQPACNTGIDAKLDLDQDGKLGGPGDAWGFGTYPGQYCFAILSRWPIRSEQVRSFANLPWAQMPGHLMPPGDPAEVAAARRLSSKSHLDVPIDVDGTVLHVLAHHPTPPVFDGPEDRNGRRNHDEIRLWADYLHEPDAQWIVDDAGGRGGLARDASFVVMGDHNADPSDGDSFPHAIAQLLDHPRIDASATPASDGAIESARIQAGANAAQQGDPAHDTADFDDRGAGNLRVDYVLPARGLQIAGAGVYWPVTDDPHARLLRASDHRAVWLDVVLAPAAPAATANQPAQR